MREIVAEPLPSLARETEPSSAPVRVALVQHRWNPDPDVLRAELREGIERAAGRGAQVVFLAELTLSRYPADVRAPEGASRLAEDTYGPTFEFAAAAASDFGIAVQASFYESAEGPDGLGLNTCILVSPAGELIGRTHKLHIPVTEGYYEDTYFRPGPALDPFPIYAPAEIGGMRLGMPTCWDEWFGEVTRAYGIAGANVLVYPTAIGSEPGFPDFDTEPLWRQVIVGHGIENGMFMVVPNRWGDEGLVTFYGSSFISDPYGRILARAPRDESAVLIADLDLAQRADWLTLFPFYRTRRPDVYGVLTHPVDPASQPGGQ